MLKHAKRVIFLTGTLTKFLQDMVEVLEGKAHVSVHQFLSKSEICIGRDQLLNF
jgi:uncharacterized membrane protein YoaK (UPF0700 family)